MVDFSDRTPKDGEVYALSERPEHTKAEFVETKGEHGAEMRIAWRLSDRFGRGILLTDEELANLCSLTKNYMDQ
jgi:hypothetical protein